jgi:hypothetical protein
VFIYDSRVDCLDQHIDAHARCRVVETHWWLAGALKQSMEFVCGGGALGVYAFRLGNYQLVVGPIFSSCQAFYSLASARAGLTIGWSVDRCHPGLLQIELRATTSLP